MYEYRHLKLLDISNTPGIDPAVRPLVLSMLQEELPSVRLLVLLV